MGQFGYYSVAAPDAVSHGLSVETRDMSRAFFLLMDPRFPYTIDGNVSR